MVVLGLLWMHAMTAAPPASHDPHRGATVQSTVDPDCDSHGVGGGCDGRRHGHPDEACQSTAAPIHGPIVVDVLTPAIYAPVPVVRALDTTVAAEAAAGTGCGPPSLAQLSVSRT